MTPPAGVKLAACLVNVSCGRRPAVVSRLAAAPLSVTAELRAGRQPALCDAETTRRLMEQHRLPAAATVLSVFSDTDYDRTVFTVAGPLASLGAAVLALCREACRLVDLREHCGNHPCLGAVDLVPVHPLTDDATLRECAYVALGIGRRLTEEVPGAACFWFGEADPQRRPLPLRRRQVGWFRRRAVLEEVDLGTPDPRLGLTGIGAIPYMTNFNVTLDSSDLELGKSIASQLRATAPGGLPGMKSKTTRQVLRYFVGPLVECMLATIAPRQKLLPTPDLLMPFSLRSIF